MLFERRMLLVVEVVKERGCGPGVEKRGSIVSCDTKRIGVAPGAGADAGFDRERVFEQAG
jgi:hypothetical protein